MLLIVASAEGFVIPYFAAPRLGLSAHTLAGLQSVLFLALGLVWPRLRLSMTLSRVAWWCLVYSGLAILAAYLMAAWWGAGNETMPLAAGAAHGSAVQEIAIKVVAYSSAPTGLIAFSLVLWGAAPRAIVVKHRAQSNVRLISLIAVARIGNIFLNGDHLLL